MGVRRKTRAEKRNETGERTIRAPPVAALVREGEELVRARARRVHLAREPAVVGIDLYAPIAIPHAALQAA